METNTVTIKPLLIVVAVIIFVEAATGYLLFREPYHPMIIMGLKRITQVFLMVLIILTWGGGVPPLGLSYPAIMPGFKKGLIWSASVGAVTILALVVVFIAGGDPFTWIHTDLPSGRTDLLLFFLVGGIIAPVAEEVFFRGVLYGFFRRWGVRAALVLSTALFVLSHPLGYGIPWPQIMGGDALRCSIRDDRKSDDTDYPPCAGKFGYLQYFSHISNSFVERPYRCAVRILSIIIVCPDAVEEGFEDQGEMAVFLGEVQYCRLHISFLEEGYAELALCCFLSPKPGDVFHPYALREPVGDFFDIFYGLGGCIGRVCIDKAVVKVQAKDVINLVADCVTPQFTPCIDQVIYRRC